MFIFKPEENMHKMFCDGIFLDYFNFASKNIEEVTKLERRLQD
jgi:hypothetical protein